MTLTAYWRPSLLLVALVLAGRGSSPAAASADTTAIADTIKTDVAQLVAGLNAHDVLKTTAYDAANIVSIECGSPSTVGIEADRKGFEMGFARDPDWRVSLIDDDPALIPRLSSVRTFIETQRAQIQVQAELIDP